MIPYYQILVPSALCLSRRHYGRHSGVYSSLASSRMRADLTPDPTKAYNNLEGPIQFEKSRIFINEIVLVSNGEFVK